MTGYENSMQRRNPHTSGKPASHSSPVDVNGGSLRMSEDHVAPHLRQAAQSPGVLVPSVLAWRVLIISPLLLWTWSLGWGMSAFDGIPENKRAVRHFMMWFDVLVFRTPAGPAIPFTVLAVRWLSTAGLRREGIQSVAPTLTSKVLVPYLAVTLGRMLLYGMHAWGQASHRLSHDASHVVSIKEEEAASDSIAYLSDHILLGASVVALLHSEAICAVSDMIKLAAVTDSDWRVMVAASALMKSILLLVLVVLDMHWTARLFHYPAESAVAFAAGLLLFQVGQLNHGYKFGVRQEERRGQHFGSYSPVFEALATCIAALIAAV